MEAERLRTLLRTQTIATMPELKAVLDADVAVTVLRKLRESDRGTRSVPRSDGTRGAGRRRR
jgi:hypothetical protein